MKFSAKRVVSGISALCILTSCLSAYTKSSGFGMRASAIWSPEGDGVVSYAENTIGIIGERPNVVTDYYGAVGEWCAMYIQYCAAMMGHANAVPYTPYCDNQYGYPGGVDFFRARGQFHDNWENYTPVRSDIIYFDWNYDYYADHVGFVTWCDGYTVGTVQGNADDRVQYIEYNINDPRIYGYGSPNYQGSGYVNGTVYNSAYYTVTSPIGAWARYNAGYGENKIGIVSTGQTVYSDMQSGEWVHSPEIVVEESWGTYDGWINSSNLSLSGSTGNNSYTPDNSYDNNYSSNGNDYYYSEPMSEYYISSTVGTWFHSTPDSYEYSRICILDTYQPIDIIDVSGDWVKAGAYYGNDYKIGYVYIPNTNYTYSYDNSYNQGFTQGTGFSHYVSSPEGINFRYSAERTDYNLIAILDTFQPVNVNYYTGEWVCVDAYVNGELVTGYVHGDYITAY